MRSLTTEIRAETSWSKTIRTARSFTSGEYLLSSCHDSILSRGGVSGKPGPVHYFKRVKFWHRTGKQAEKSRMRMMGAYNVCSSEIFVRCTSRL